MLLLAVLAACSIGSCLALNNGFTVQGASVRVIFPSGYGDKRLDMAMADFGDPVYGGTMWGRLVYPSEDPSYSPDGQRRRCNDVACEYACTSLLDAKPEFDLKRQPNERIIMLVDRGPRGQNPCYFLTKVYNAQLAGADAVLVANDDDSELTTAVVPQEEEVAHLADELTVSAALITKKDGEFLKSLIKDQTKVTLALNWTNLEPRGEQVSWEFWTTTNDQCGTPCKEQKAFLMGMKQYARALDQANLTTFSPHYMVWSCPPQYAATTECQTECYLNGTYCAPDPDGWFGTGYSGRDVLAMNVHSLCFARLAQQAGAPWLWWDYAEAVATNCTSELKQYTTQCADQVFTQVNGQTLLGGNGTTSFQACVASGTPPAAGEAAVEKLSLFEQELTAQLGGGEVAAVSILPTVRVNGRQYRGTLSVAGVMRAICAAFPEGKEPSVCNEKWVSENECELNSVGYKNCRVGDPLAAGRTRCINTFSSYSCECGQGWTKVVKDTGEETCEDINECYATNVRLTDPLCSCPRCACINMIGSYKCTGELEDQCTAKYNYGGCWRQSELGGSTYHACVDAIKEYQWAAARGTLQPGDHWHKCQCPGCFQNASSSTAANLQCAPMCPLNQCVNGVCAGAGPTPGPGGTPSGGPTPAPAPGQKGGSGSSGMSAAGVLLVVLVSVGATVTGMYAVYHYVLRQRMEGEIRDIMSQYMPLDSRGRRGGGGGGGRGGLSHLAPVEEEDQEDAPLMAPGRGSSSAAAAAAAPAASGPHFAAGSPQRGVLFGRGAGASTQPMQSFPKQDSYQPPAPVPDDDDAVSGLQQGGGRHEGGIPLMPAAREQRESPKAGPQFNDPPLLGDGPL